MDKRKGLWAGYKKLGPVQRFLFCITVVGILLSVVFYFFPISTPSELEIAQLADRALWRGTQNCGDRTSYSRLVSMARKTRNIELKNTISEHIERIKQAYKSSTLELTMPTQVAVFKLHIKPYELEPTQGFQAKNVVDHLRYPECSSRAKAAFLLRNIESATDKDSVDKKEILERLIFIIKSDSSLLVSKLALDRYSQFTDFSPTDIFDFQGAINHWNKDHKK